MPLPFVHTSSPIYLAGIARPGPTDRENRAVHAMARLLLHGRIDNIQTSWVKLGVAGTEAMLQGGCNDLGGTLMEETIFRMAGSKWLGQDGRAARDGRRHRPPRPRAHHPLRDPLTSSHLRTTHRSVLHHRGVSAAPGWVQN